MSSRKISWEIVLAGLTFIAIGIYLADRTENSPQTAASVRAPQPPQAPLPSSLVIDLGNLENLKNLENLRNLENLKNLENLEIKLRNIEKLIDAKAIAESEEAMQKSLKQIEEQLQAIEHSDFKVRLQDRKLFVSKNFDVEEAAWSQVSSRVYIYRKRFDASAISAMKFNTDFGNIHITGSNGGTAEIILQASGDFSSVNDIEGKLAVRSNFDDHPAFFQLSRTERIHRPDPVSLDATLSVPQGMVVEASTGGGHIQVSHVHGEQKLSTDGGHITLDHFKGSVDAHTKGGHITCTDVEGNLALSTSGGHIQLHRTSGDIDIRTAGGHIELMDVEGKTAARTSGGNINAVFKNIAESLNLSTSAGNITLAMPAGTQADIDARGSRVSIDKNFIFEGSKTDRILSGSLNGGGPAVTLSCGYGNVVIKSNE